MFALADTMDPSLSTIVLLFLPVLIPKCEYVWQQNDAPVLALRALQVILQRAEYRSGFWERQVDMLYTLLDHSSSAQVRYQVW